MKPLIPPTITDLATSKKGVTFYLMLGLFMLRDQVGLTADLIWPLTACFAAYVLAQGISDMGTGRAISADAE